MAQRSLHAVTKVYYRIMSFLLWIPHQRPLLHHVGKAYHKVGHTVWCHSQLNRARHTLPILFLISKLDVPYRTCGGTCCPGVSTPKIQSLANSSTTCHDGINHLHHSNHYSNHSIDPYTRSSHILMDGGPQHSHKDTSQTQDHKGWKTCMTLMIAWLSITNQVWNPNPKGVRLR
jgi:hypothetical protein